METIRNVRIPLIEEAYKEARLIVALDMTLPFLYLQPIPKRVLITSISSAKTPLQGLKRTKEIFLQGTGCWKSRT